MLSPRERRLQRELERMLALKTEHSLFEFLCADLSVPEGAEYLKTRMRREVVTMALPDYLPPDEYMKRHPHTPPEKYLILYGCTGLERTASGAIEKTSFHMMMVVFGWDYPSVAPKFVWMTPIWHPNISLPYICTEGLPFAVGLTLPQIVQTVGEMIQYRSYNVADPLNHEAAEWARNHESVFPIDDRDLVDRRRRVSRLRDATRTHGDPLVELLDVPPERVVTLIEPGSVTG